MATSRKATAAEMAVRLAELYEESFGGKDRGRYRISMKYLRELSGCPRLYVEDTRSIERELYARGYVLVDLESFFVVLSQKTFGSYRRVSSKCLEPQPMAPETPPPPGRRPPASAGTAAN